LAKDRDYDYVVGKLPRKDKEGKDTTSDRIGKGGRHRVDGTYSSVVYDIEVIDELPAQRDPEPYYPDECNEPRRTSYGDLPWWGQLIVNVAEERIPIVMDGLTEMAKESFRTWQYNRRMKKEAERQARLQASRTQSRKPMTKAERILQEQEKKKKKHITSVQVQTTTAVMPDEFDEAYEQYTVNMTSEEAQKELLDAFILYVLAAKKLNRVANANVVDYAGKITEGRTMIEKISAPEVIGKINAILENNPGLLEEWQSVALSGIIGGSLLVEKEYVPIQAGEFKRQLMGFEINEPKKES
jgi:DNA polymerase II small subunit/DNA polymerase delta subunit B